MPLHQLFDGSIISSLDSNDLNIVFNAFSTDIKAAHPDLT